LQPIAAHLAELAKTYKATVEKVQAINNPTYTDFMARRLVEMAGNIIMSYLLLQDADRNDSFMTSLNVYIKLAFAEVTKHAEFINSFNLEDLKFYTVK
jgi:hypothetical protein